MTDIGIHPDTGEYCGPAQFKGNQERCREWNFKQKFFFKPNSGSGRIRLVIPKIDPSTNEPRQSWVDPYPGSPVFDYVTANKIHNEIEAGVNGIEALLNNIDAKEVSIAWLESIGCPERLMPDVNAQSKERLTDVIDELSSCRSQGQHSSRGYREGA